MPHADAPTLRRLRAQWRVSLRGESFDDQDGDRTGVAGKWQEATRTPAGLSANACEIRAEARADKFDRNAFRITPTDKQSSVALEVLYKS